MMEINKMVQVTPDIIEQAMTHRPHVCTSVFVSCEVLFHFCWYF